MSAIPIVQQFLLFVKGGEIVENSVMDDTQLMLPSLALYDILLIQPWQLTSMEFVMLAYLIFAGVF